MIHLDICRIAVSFSSILKNSSIKFTIRPWKGGVGVDSDDRTEHDSRYELGGNEIGSSEVDGSKAEDNKIGKKG